MSKNKKSTNVTQKQNVAEEVKAQQEVKVETSNVATVSAEKKDANKDKKKNAKKKPQKEKGKLKRKAKETMSEIKKVTWPTFGEVCKKTGVVLVVVLVFALVVFGIDVGLGALIGLLK